MRREIYTAAKKEALSRLFFILVVLVLVRVRIGHDGGAAGRADKVFAVFEHFLVEIGVFTAAGAFEFHKIVVVILFDVKKLIWLQENHDHEPQHHRLQIQDLWRRASQRQHHERFCFVNKP